MAFQAIRYVTCLLGKRLHFFIESKHAFLGLLSRLFDLTSDLLSLSGGLRTSTSGLNCDFKSSLLHD